MIQLALILLALAWGAATGLRIYRQARFYQIDEYKSNRYLRWWLATRERALPSRVVFLSEGGLILPLFIGTLTGEAECGLMRVGQIISLEGLVIQAGVYNHAMRVSYVP
jgi:hypothetical protein